jgi:iron(III) transport system permease protein
MKELPATLILRPFNFDTLATFVYQFASDELIEQASLGALGIVLSGLIPVIVLSRIISATRRIQIL